MVAGTGFEPVTFGLWARRAARLLHPASDSAYVSPRNKTIASFWYICQTNSYLLIKLLKINPVKKTNMMGFDY